jgi:hypothetical protein
MKVAFTTTLDDRYLSGFLITFNSILRNSKNFNHDLIIFEWGNLSDDSKTIIKQFYDKVTFKSVETDLYENHKYDETFRKWTYNCNYRFDIFTLEEYDRIVFFDCDMVFEIDTDELLAYDVDFGASGVALTSGTYPNALLSYAFVNTERYVNFESCGKEDQVIGWYVNTADGNLELYQALPELNLAQTDNRLTLDSIIATNLTSVQKQQLASLQSTMNSLASQISSLTGQFGDGSEQATMQTQTNVQGLQGYLKDMKVTDGKIKGFDTMIENILNDSDIVVLQKNYEYLFWSILATGAVLVTMNIVKK